MIYTKKRGKMKKISNQVIFLVLILAVIATGYGCSGKEKSSKKEASLQSESVKPIESTNQFDSVLQSSGRKLLVFDLYADWCGPCKILAPILEEVAKEQNQKADFYKIDVDKHTRIAQQFRVKGIPYVVFVKEGQVIHTMTGVQPKVTYLEAVEKHQ